MNLQMSSQKWEKKYAYRTAQQKISKCVLGGVKSSAVSRATKQQFAATAAALVSALAFFPPPHWGQLYFSRLLSNSNLKLSFL